MTHEDFVTYEQAVKLKELGFDWKTFSYYLHRYKGNDGWRLVMLDKLESYNDPQDTTCISAPTLAQTQKWLRLVKNITVNVIIDDNSNDPWSYEVLSNVRDEDGDWVYLIPQWKTNFWSETPEEALSAGIDKAIELLKQQSNGK